LSGRGGSTLARRSIRSSYSTPDDCSDDHRRVLLDRFDDCDDRQRTVDVTRGPDGHRGDHRWLAVDPLRDLFAFLVLYTDFAIEMADRIDRPERQRLMQSELVLQVEVDTYSAPQLIGFGGELEEAGIAQRPIDSDRAADVMSLATARLVVVDHQPAHRTASVTGPVEQTHDHLVIHIETRCQRFGFTPDELVVHILVPMGVAALRRLLLHHLLLFLGVGLCPLRRAQVLDDVFGRLHPDIAPVVEPPATGAAGNLLELPNSQDSDVAAVVFAQLREKHRSNRHVDTDTESVGTTDDLEEPGLREALDEQPVLRQQAGMVHPDAADEETPETLAERRIEAEPTDQCFDLLLLILRQRVETEVSLCRLGGLALGEVDEIDRCPTGREQLLDRAMQRARAIREVERHRAERRRHQRGLPAGPFGEICFEECGRPERRRHEEELTMRQFEER